MNIFDALRVFALPTFPIFQYKGMEIINAIFESWGASTAPDDYLFPDRLETIVSIVRAKAIRYRFEKHDDKILNFNELISELCPNNMELAEETSQLLNKAISIDNSIKAFRGKTKYDLKINVNEDDVNEIVTGPIYYGASYDEFVSSAIDFDSDEIKEVFLNEVLLDFEDPIYFDDDATHTDVVEASLDYLNQMHIYKSRAMDLLKAQNGGYFLCIDANKRFNDGDCIKIDSAWIFGQKTSNLSVVIIS